MGYVGNAPAEKYTTIDKQTLTGNSTVGPYTLTHSVGNEQEIEVFVNNVRQEPGVSYTVSSNQLTMSASVASADDFYVIFQGKAKMTATHPPTFDLTAANGTFTGTVTTGGLTVGSDTAKTKFYSNSTYNGIYNGSALTNNESIYMGSGTLFFYSGGGERMRIDSSGNVGIGSTDAGNAGTLNLSVGQAGTIAGGIQLWSPTNAAHYIQFGDGTTGVDTYRGAVGYNHSADALLMLTASTERMRIDSSGNVKIGTTTNAWSGSNTLVIKEDSGDGGITLVSSSTSNNMNIGFADTETSSFADMRGLITYLHANDAMRFMTANAEAVRIDSSGNLLVGKTTLDYDGTAGLILRGDGLINATRSGGNVTDFNRLSTDGEVVRISKDGTTVGGIASRGGAAASFVAYTGSGNGAGVGGSTNMIIPASETGAAKDAGVNLGSNSTRWKDLYLSGGVYLGGTGSANHLDDYEEGTWVPTVSSAASYGVQTGLYTKIGNLVNIQCQVQFVQSGTVFGSVSGLPFTVATVNYSGITFREWYSTGVTLSGNLTIGALSTSGFWNYANSSTATNGQTYGYGFSISYRT